MVDTDFRCCFFLVTLYPTHACVFLFYISFIFRGLAIARLLIIKASEEDYSYQIYDNLAVRNRTIYLCYISSRVVLFRKYFLTQYFRFQYQNTIDQKSYIFLKLYYSSQRLALQIKSLAPLVCIYNNRNKRICKDRTTLVEKLESQLELLGIIGA